ncbi:MAG: DUF4199 domain-containing protein [Bacteroidia bacterium]|nr:DUF4199 domain-containing protein [Bacteroidia bacterium]NNF30444.1 DUF4199 domain-containing protein [Flavobacteriaceae bacterium]MBT8275655.1 DUF4199 domain-containing protein [Bacteroidia bacterium]NNJ82677.1 DUF4199 domain-containing protein [Flavobacteriaceae bacterium]NNK54298.1 DUF4199 domain-containing protein [Flavobacteriaceae bacterium]
MGKIYSTYGTGTAVVLVAYFLLTKLIGLHQYPVLSAANGVIIGAGIFFALKKYKSTVEAFKYQDGFQLGLFTGGLATIIFSTFMALYIFIVDTEFAKAILDSWNLNFNKGSLILIISLVIMGFATTFVLTLSFMQLLKESWNPKR